MKLKFFSLFFLFVFSTSVFSQENIKPTPLNKKGQIFLFWGWNRAVYSNSDIRFKGEGYDFQLKDVIATDRQTAFSFKNYFRLDRITIPQTNARIGYFIKDNLAIVFGLDHMKYVMKQNQTVDYSGNILNSIYSGMIKNEKVDLSNGEFLTFEHTDGLNYINIGVEEYNNLLKSKSFDIAFSYGAGLGVLFPKVILNYLEMRGVIVFILQDLV